MMAVQAFIISEVDESEQMARRTLKQRGPAPIFFQVKTFFQWQAFSFSECSSQKREQLGAWTLLRVHIQNNWKGTAKKEVMAAALWSWSSALHLFIHWKPVIFTGFTKLTTKLLAPFLFSPHIHVEQNEASMHLTRLSGIQAKKWNKLIKKKKHWHKTRTKHEIWLLQM